MGQKNEEVIKCRHCNQQFGEKWNLMTHRKLKHIETVAYCQKKLEGKCSFSDELCWWKHTGDQHSTEENIECFICHNTFESKPNLMRHRKISHPNVIRQCNNFAQNMCKFQGSSCWFRHDEKAMETDEIGNRGVKENSEENVKSDSVFQKAFMNIKPPIKKPNKEKTD